MVFSPPPLRRLHRFLAPLVAFAAAFMRSFRRAPPFVSAPAEALHALHTQNSALQAEIARLQRSLPQREQLQFLQAAVNSVTDGVLLCDNAGQTTLNPAARSLLGLLGAGDLSDLPADTLRYPSGQSVPPGAFPWTRAALARIPADWTPYLLARDAHDLRSVEIAARPVPEGAVAVVRDISAQTNAAAWEAQARGTQQALAEAARRLARTPDFQALCQLAADAALALLPPAMRPGARAVLCTFGGQGQPIVLRAASPDEGKKRPRRYADTLPPLFEFDAQSPLLWKVYLDRQTVACADINNDPLFAGTHERALLQSPFQAAHTVRSALMLPLLPGAAASGHLLLTSPLPHAFAPDTQDALSLLASLTASLLARAQSDTLRHTQDDQLTLLRQAALAAATASGSDTFADTLTRCAAAALGASLCVLSLADPPPASPPTRVALPLRVWGTPPPDMASLRPEHGSAAPHCPCTRTTSTAVRRGLPAAQIAIPNPPLGECVWRAFGGQSGTHSALALPLRVHDTVRGALTVFRQGSAPFSPPEISLAETFAALASLALPGTNAPAHPSSSDLRPSESAHAGEGFGG